MGSVYWYSSIWITLTTFLIACRTWEDRDVAAAALATPAAALRDKMAAAARYRSTHGQEVWMVLR